MDLGFRVLMMDRDLVSIAIDAIVEKCGRSILQVLVQRFHREGERVK